MTEDQAVPLPDGEIHELSLASRLIDDIIRQWLDTAHGLASAADQDVDAMRYLHLDNYWYAVTPKILDALKRAGLLADQEVASGE